MSNNDFREVDESGDDVIDTTIVESDSSDVKPEDKGEDKKNENKDEGYENICFICHRTESQAGPMINIGSGVCICNECMQRTFDSMNNFNNTQENTGGAFDFSKMPNIGMINLADFGMPNSQKIKKKKNKSKEKTKAEGNAENSEEDKPVIDIKNIIPPHEIKAKLDEYVVGQDYAKKVMSVAVYNHYKRVANDPEDDIEIEKSNMLMIGPTGSGKTYLVKTLARLLDVPLAITDATSLTEAGYIGDDIESVVSKLLAAADNDVEKAECGIIFIDEIDKLAKKKNANQRDVSGESVQQGMLKLLEGAEVEVPVGASSKNAMVPMTTIDTKNILFICGGAFPDLDSIVKERLNKSSSMGFTGELKDKYDKDKDILMKTTTEDLKKFGMIPEFIGRLPILFSTQSLDEEMLVRILKEPKNAILKQYQKLLALDEVKLTFTDGALHAIARKAMKRELGARALRAIIEEFMLDIMYEIPKDDNIGAVEITEEYIDNEGGPSITMRGATAIEDKNN
ncbi:MAG: ATP-dependent Clp protease ATP-binding subunit ClpX [Lachnospiraceae bacterium]|nr:ATP-dependent Clp protease ATP-binding subunit ClpX [Lachnospiraceae bacterium]